MLDCAPEHRQLLTEGQVLKRDRAVSAADQREGTEQEEKRGQHERSCAAIDQRIIQSLTIRILANDRQKREQGPTATQRPPATSSAGPHAALPARSPVSPPTEWGEARVQRRDRLGGVVHEYALAA